MTLRTCYGFGPEISMEKNKQIPGVDKAQLMDACRALREEQTQAQEFESIRAREDEAAYRAERNSERLRVKIENLTNEWDNVGADDLLKRAVYMARANDYQLAKIEREIDKQAKLLERIESLGAMQNFGQPQLKRLEAALSDTQQQLEDTRKRKQNIVENKDGGPLAFYRAQLIKQLQRKDRLMERVDELRHRLADTELRVEEQEERFRDAGIVSSRDYNTAMDTIARIEPLFRGNKQEMGSMLAESALLDRTAAELEEMQSAATRRLDELGAHLRQIDGGGGGGQGGVISVGSSRSASNLSGQVPSDSSREMGGGRVPPPLVGNETNEELAGIKNRLLDTTDASKAELFNRFNDMKPLQAEYAQTRDAYDQEKQVFYERVGPLEDNVNDLSAELAEIEGENDRYSSDIMLLFQQKRFMDAQVHRVGKGGHELKEALENDVRLCEGRLRLRKIEKSELDEKIATSGDQRQMWNGVKQLLGFKAEELEEALGEKNFRPGADVSDHSRRAAEVLKGVRPRGPDACVFCHFDAV